MWMCDEAYFGSPDIKELARHFADYGYMFDDPGRVIVNDAGEVISPGTSPAGHGDHGGHRGRTGRTNRRRKRGR
jgi:hypothetical protein